MPGFLTSFFILTVGLSPGFAGILSSVIVGAASLAASYALAKLTAKKQTKPKASQFQDTIRQSVTPRRRSYGTVLVSGPMAFYEARGDYVYVLILMNSGTIEFVEEWWLSDKLVEIDANQDVVTAPYRLKGAAVIRLEWGLGWSDQASSPMLQAAFPEWTANHRLSGIAWTLMRLKKVPAENFQAVYNGSTPALRQTMRGTRCYNPRDPLGNAYDSALWGSTENPVMQLLDYCTNVDGMWLARSLFNEDLFSAEANLCDAGVPLKAGGTEPRYVSSGTYELTDEPTQVIDNILATCGGLLYLAPDGTIGVEVDRWYEPECTITPDDIIAFEINSGVSRLQAYRAQRAKYTSPPHNYKEQATKAIYLPGVAIGTAIIQDLDLPWVKSNSQALRLAKLKLYRDNPAYAGSLTLTVSGLQLTGQRRFRLTTTGSNKILNIDAVCEIKRYEIEGDLKTVRVDFQTLDFEGFSWNPETEELDAPPVPPDTRQGDTLVAPSGLRFRTGLRGAVMWGGVSWNTTPATQTAEFRYRRGTNDWVDVEVPAGQNFVEWDNLVSGSSYEANVRFVDSSGNVTTWSTVTRVAADDSAVPADPTALAATGGIEAITVSATQSSSSVAFVLEFFDAPDSFTVPSFDPIPKTHGVAASTSSGDLTYPTPDGSRKVWVRARTVANVYSNIVGPVTVGVTAISTGLGGGGDSGGGADGGGAGTSGTGGGTGGSGDGSGGAAP